LSVKGRMSDQPGGTSELLLENDRHMSFSVMIEGRGTGGYDSFIRSSRYVHFALCTHARDYTALLSCHLR